MQTVSRRRTGGRRRPRGERCTAGQSRGGRPPWQCTPSPGAPPARPTPPCTASAASPAGRGGRATASATGGPPEPSPEPPTERERLLAEGVSPTYFVAMGGRLPSRRRLALGGTLAASVAVGGNFLGTTSRLLALDGGRTAARLHLDVLYPVRGFKRCWDSQNGFEFLYPAAWLVDQRLYRRYAERVEQRNPLDPPALRPKRRNQLEPVAGFGPPGSTGETNVSVVLAPIQQGFSLRKMGSPAEAGRIILNTIIAPPGSGKEAVLLEAKEAVRGGDVFYRLDYTVERFDASGASVWKRHNVSAYTVRDSLLYSLNAQCPEADWDAQRAAFTTMQESFALYGAAFSSEAFSPELTGGNTRQTDTSGAGACEDEACQRLLREEYRRRGEAVGASPGTTQGTTRSDLTSPDPDRALGDPLAPRGPAAALRSGAGAGQLTWSPEGVARTGNPLESE